MDEKEFEMLCNTPCPTCGQALLVCECEQVVPCSKCGAPMKYREYAKGFPGEGWDIWDCPACGNEEWEGDFTEESVRASVI